MSYKSGPANVERYGLPEDLPEPVDDGQADHLTGRHLPTVSLPATSGASVNLSNVSSGRWVLFIYPTTGVPGEDMPPGWDEIPGARGCSPEACGFRDNLDALVTAGADAIFGLSVQGSDYQRELVGRLDLSYELLSDSGFELGRALGLPTFRAGDETFYKRLTLVIRGTTVEHVFYPVFPPNEHATQVLEWLNRNPAC